MGLGAIPQAPRLNLGKFRGSCPGGLKKLGHNVEPTSIEKRKKSESIYLVNYVFSIKNVKILTSICKALRKYYLCAVKY
jgi:hypothetical protein